MRPISALAAPPSINGLEVKLIDDGRLAVTYNPGVFAAGAVIDQLHAAGIEIADLDTRGAELENVFLKLTSQGKKT